jgi:hypothetical protein
MPWLILLRKVPREFWYLLAVVALFAVLRWHWIDVGYDRCMEGNRKAQEAAAIEAKKQEAEAPKVADDAKAEVQPVIEKRVIYVNKTNTVSCDEPYSDGVQSEIHKAEATIDRLRSRGNPKDGKADD